VLLTDRCVIDYQVFQTARGVDVDALTTASADFESLESDLRAALRRCGLVDPVVNIRPVEALTRDAATGKLRRVVRADTPVN